MADKNQRETGARAGRIKRNDRLQEQFSQDAAANKQPANGMGNSAPVDETPSKTRQSDGHGTRP